MILSVLCEIEICNTDLFNDPKLDKRDDILCQIGFFALFEYSNTLEMCKNLSNRVKTFRYDTFCALCDRNMQH